MQIKGQSSGIPRVKCWKMVTSTVILFVSSGKFSTLEDLNDFGVHSGRLFVPKHWQERRVLFWADGRWSVTLPLAEISLRIVVTDTLN
jgi:hypothetical protein